MLARLGNQFVKVAHNQNEGLAESRRVASHRQPYWLLGMFCITIVNTALNLAAFAFAAQSLLATLGSIALVWNLIVSKFFSREQPGLYEYVGTSVALVGVTLCTTFGPHNTTNYDIHKLKDLYTRTMFIIYACLLAALMAVLFVCKDRNVPFRRISAAALPGCFGGLTALFSKSTVELIKSATRGNPDFRSPVTYAIIAAAICCAVSQIILLNRCIKRYDPLFIVPVYNSCLLITGAVSGIIYFEEYKNLNAVSRFMFPVGVLVTLGALAIFANRPKRAGDQIVKAASGSGSRTADTSDASAPTLDEHAARAPSAGDGDDGDDELVVEPERNGERDDDCELAASDAAPSPQRGAGKIELRRRSPRKASAMSASLTSLPVSSGLHSLSESMHTARSRSLSCDSFE